MLFRSYLSPCDALPKSVSWYHQKEQHSPRPFFDRGFFPALPSAGSLHYNSTLFVLFALLLALLYDNDRVINSLGPDGLRERCWNKWCLCWYTVASNVHGRMESEFSEDGRSLSGRSLGAIMRGPGIMDFGISRQDPRGEILVVKLVEVRLHLMGGFVDICFDNRVMECHKV